MYFKTFLLRSTTIIHTIIIDKLSIKEMTATIPYVLLANDM